jgi:imidazolonepropionase-like amidohydrolase
MRMMRDKQIYAVPTFAISEYFAAHAAKPEDASRLREGLNLHYAEFQKQLAAGVPMAVGSDVGPFPHGTQAHELTLMAAHGMTPVQVLQADLVNGAKLLDWDLELGQLKAGYLADIIAVPGNPVTDITVVEHVGFVMKNGSIVKSLWKVK